MRLKTKVIIFFLALAFTSGSLIIGLTWRTVHASEVKQLGQIALDKASDLAEMLTPEKMGSEVMLLPLLQAAQKASVDSDYVAVLDTQGRVVAHTNVAAKGAVYTDPLTRHALQEKLPGFQIVKRDGEVFLEAWAPVWAPQGDESGEEFLLGGIAAPNPTLRLGTVRVSFPMRETLQAQLQIVRGISLIVAVVGAVAFFFTLGLMRRFLIPIQLLADGTGRIAHGRYGIEVPVTSSDELGDLAMSFNRMSVILSETTVSKNFLGDILSHMIDPLIVVDLDGRLRMVNQATLDLLGYADYELKEKPASLLFVTEVKAMAAGAVRNVELELVAKSGVKVPVLFSSSILKTDDGHATGIIAVAKDMTERRRLEGIIRQSDKMSAVGQLAAGVAHEINNPLGVILGFAQAVVRRLQPNDPLEMPLKSIEKEAVRCRNLVQDLLTFSRASKIDREPMDLNRAVEGAFSLVIAQARMTHVQVNKELAVDLPRILGNLNQIQQIIINLANNALDAMGDAAGQVTVKTEILKDGPLAWVCLSVTDTGPGIPPEILPRIFEPFFTTKPVGKGTGLGLSLVHEIIKKHSGTTDVESRPGHTVFRIKFPVHQAQAPRALESAAPQ